jgi:hypothetical protein
MAYRALVWRHNNPEKRSLQSRIYKTRSRLRELGVLPPVGGEMNDEQKKIYDQLGKGDFSFWNTIKSRNGHDGGTKVNHTPCIIKTAEELLWERTRQSSKERNMIFDINPEDIVIPEYCPITNIPISVNFEDRNSDNYYVLDKIDWLKGVVKENIRVVSKSGLSKRINELYKEGFLDCVDYTPQDIQKEVCIKTRRSAKLKKIEFNLKPEDIVIPEYCPYFKCKLSFNKKDCRESFYYTVDRIDSSKGYIKGNVEIISKLANTMKNSATQEELISFAKGILDIHKNS